MRASPSSRRSWNLRASIAGIVSGICASAPRECDSEADALEHAGSDEPVRDCCDRGLRIARIGIHKNRLDLDARLPLRECALNAVANQLTHCRRVGLEQEARETTAELRQLQTFALVRH